MAQFSDSGRCKDEQKESLRQPERPGVLTVGLSRPVMYVPEAKLAAQSFVQAPGVAAAGQREDEQQ